MRSPGASPSCPLICAALSGAGVCVRVECVGQFWLLFCPFFSLSLWARGPGVLESRRRRARGVAGGVGGDVTVCGGGGGGDPTGPAPPKGARQRRRRDCGVTVGFGGLCLCGWAGRLVGGGVVGGCKCRRSSYFFFYKKCMRKTLTRSSSAGAKK